MSAAPSPAYNLAMSLKPDLEKRAQAVETKLNSAKFNNNVATFKAIIGAGRPCINMSLPRCVDFLKTGEYLNVYEFVRDRLKKTGADFDNEVKSNLGAWYDRRTKIDTLFQFTHDTHYSALNIGGPGAPYYGLCCVILNLDNWSPVHTCFGGDSIRACFTKDKTQVVDDKQMLENFGIGPDVVLVSLIKLENFVETPKTGIDVRALRGVVEKSDALIELHLHGPVRREHIVEIVMAEEDFESLSSKTARAERLTPPWPQEYDDVPFFKEFLKLVNDVHVIPFKRV
jgi:hypothetical protein